MAHSAYPELGESAIEKFLNALERIRRIEIPTDEVLGPSTLNIGTITGGRAPNVIPDEAQAEIFIRVVGDVSRTCADDIEAAVPDAQANEVLFIPAVHLGSLEDLRRRSSRTQPTFLHSEMPGAAISDRTGHHPCRAHQ